MAAMPGDLVDPSDDSVTARAKLERVHGHPIADDTRVAWTELGGVRCAWVDTPLTRDMDRTLMLCHGGAYIAASGDGYLFYAEMLARHCRARVLLVDYRLAPKHRFPAAMDDCAGAYRALVDGGRVAPNRIAFIGDSCGGGLAITALLRLRDTGAVMPAGAVTLGGWFDLEASSDAARRPLGRDPFVHPDFTVARGRDYVGPRGDLRDPLVSAVHADPSGLPPLLLQVGQIDCTRDDAIRLADRAARAGVAVKLEVYPGMIHGFQGLANAGIPEAVQALESVATFVHLAIP